LLEFPFCAHEKHQEIGDRILDFDDVVVIKDILGKR